MLLRFSSLCARARSDDDDMVFVVNKCNGGCDSVTPAGNIDNVNGEMMFTVNNRYDK